MFIIRSFLLSTLLALAIGSTTSFASDAIEYDATRLYIGEQKQFFFDNLVVESVQNVTREMHRPVKQKEPLIQADRPWEHVTYFTCNAWRVLRDPADGLMKCWYEDWLANHDEWTKAHDWQGGPAGYPSRCLYAQSKDGVHWEKPELGIVIEDGHNTNIVYGDREYGSVHAPFVLLDPLENNPEHRFKMLFNHRPRTGLGESGSYRWLSSRDGVDWKPWGKLPRFGHMGAYLGDVLTVAVDMESHTYLLNTRHHHMTKPLLDHHNPSVHRNLAYYPNDPRRQGKRRVFRAESADLIHWPDVQPILIPNDKIDNIDDAFYGMVQYKTGGMWIGFLNVFHMTDNMLDVQLVFSRDGRTFYRFMPSHPWLQTGESGNWDQCMVNICSPPVKMDEELYIYYGGAKNHHDWYLWKNDTDAKPPESMDKVAYCLGLAKMKRDRFVSLHAGAVRQGILVTQPFYTSGGRLVINACSTEGGNIEVQVADGKTSKILTGFEKEQCDSFNGDDVAHHVTWKSKGRLPGGWIKLHIFLRDADLYTFQIKR